MNESKPTCGWNDSTPPFPGQQDVGALSRRLYCGGCCHFDREAWEEMNTTIAELREEVAYRKDLFTIHSRDAFAEYERFTKEIAELRERNDSQRRQIELLEQMQDDEIHEHVRLSEEGKDKIIAELREELAQAQNALANAH